MLRSRRLGVPAGPTAAPRCHLTPSPSGCRCSCIAGQGRCGRLAHACGDCPCEPTQRPAPPPPPRSSAPQRRHHLGKRRPRRRLLRPAALHEGDVGVQADKGGGVGAAERVAQQHRQAAAACELLGKVPQVGGAPGQLPAQQLPHHDAAGRKRQTGRRTGQPVGQRGAAPWQPAACVRSGAPRPTKGLPLPRQLALRPPYRSGLRRVACGAPPAARRRCCASTRRLPRRPLPSLPSPALPAPRRTSWHRPAGWVT